MNSLFDSMVAECYSVPDRISGTPVIGTKLVTQSDESSVPNLSTKEFAANYLVKVKDPDIGSKDVEIDYVSAANQLVVRIVDPNTNYINKYTSTIAFNHPVDAANITASRNKCRLKILVPKSVHKSEENKLAPENSPEKLAVPAEPETPKTSDTSKSTGANYTTENVKDKEAPAKEQERSSAAKNADTESQSTEKKSNSSSAAEQLELESSK